MHYIENSHDSNDRFNWIDEDLYAFLKNGYESSYFNNTAIFLFSDHGARFNFERSGSRYNEERMPFFSLYLPNQFKLSHPDKVKNLKANKDKLTSPFDIYATIRDLTCLDTG